MEKLINNCLSDIIPTLRNNNETALQFKDVLYPDRATGTASNFTAWIMHMAGSPMFLQQKIVYESRLEKYRNTMTLFVTNVEENIESNIDEVSI